MSDNTTTGKTGDVGHRPPPPVTVTGPAPPPPVHDNTIPGTAGDRDPIAEENAALPLGKTRADFREEEFDRVLQQHGKRVQWRKAMKCPCRNDASGQARVDCLNCDGSGFIYVDPIEIRAHMASFEADTRLYEKFGLWVNGEVSITTQPEYRLAWRDSIEMLDDLMNHNELIEKNDRVGKRQSLSENTDAARYRIAKLTKAIVQDADDNIVVLEIGIHLTVNEQGHIVWTGAGNTLVANGSVVSIHYDFHPVWIVISHPHAQRSDVKGTKVPQDTVTPLPLQAAAQLDFLAVTEQTLPVTGAC